MQKTSALLVLTTAVLVAHVIVLRSTSIALDNRMTLATRAFSTRSIEIKPPAKAAVALPRRPASPPPKAVRKAPVPARSDSARTPVVIASSTAVREMAAPTPDPVPAAEPNPAPVVDAPAEPPAAPASAPATQPPASASATQTDLATLPKDAALPARAYTIPSSMRLNFNAVGKRGRLEYKAMGELLWLHDGEQYQLQLEMGDWIIGTRVIASTGRITADGLAPKRFSDKFRSERAAHFDREKGEIVFSANTPRAKLQPGAQDQVSVFVQLASLVGGDLLAYPIGATITIQTVGPRSAQPWTFTVEREEMLHLVSGDIPSLKMTRIPGQDYDQKVELWLAPALSFLPARIRITFANGDFIDQQWRSTDVPTADSVAQPERATLNSPQTWPDAR